MVFMLLSSLRPIRLKPFESSAENTFAFPSRARMSSNLGILHLTRFKALFKS